MTETTVTNMAKIGPVEDPARIASIDILRGFALLGILVVNIDFFALPMAIFFNPTVAGGFTGLNLLTWQFNELFFLQKMMALFSMLFGAGVILMYNRTESTGGIFGGIWYRRILWLFIFGLIHGYFFWYGDILFMYAFCGLLLYPLRRRSARALIIIGLFILMIGPLLSFASGFSLSMLRDQAVATEQAEAAGEEISGSQSAMRDQWQAIEKQFVASPEYIAEETEAYRGEFREMMSYRAGQTLMMQTQGFFFRELWRILGLMILGMALLKLGVFSGDRPPRFYMLSIVIGYGIGLPLCAYGMNDSLSHGFDFVHFFTVGGLYNYLGSILVALGNIGILMLIFKAEVMKWLTRRLAAVGRMALTNYLTHTLICTTIFYGYGLGLFGKVERFYLLLIVFTIWILQLYISPLWLKHFRFGPAEWLWRTLTYMKRQPMRVR